MYNGFSNYSTWAVFNYISNNEAAYNKYYAMCEKISGPDVFELKNALEDDLKSRGSST